MGFPWRRFWFWRWRRWSSRESPDRVAGAIQFLKQIISAMPKYVAFLRAIIVGGHIVKMDQVRSLFEAMGFSNVETFIASGNVIFDSKSKSAKALEGKIERALEDNLGYPVKTFIRSIAELAAVARYKPFQDCLEDGNVLYIAFVGDVPGDESTQRLLSFSTKVDDFPT